MEAISNGLINGLASIADPNIKLQVAGKYNIKRKLYDATLNLEHLQPSVLGVKMADKDIYAERYQGKRQERRCRQLSGHWKHPSQTST